MKFVRMKFSHCPICRCELKLLHNNFYTCFSERDHFEYKNDLDFYYSIKILINDKSYQLRSSISQNYTQVNEFGNNDNYLGEIIRLQGYTEIDVNNLNKIKNLISKLINLKIFL